MDCERFDTNSMGLLYGELDELSEAATLRHLHHCTRCRGIWGHLRTTRELAQLPQEDPPEDLTERIIQAEKIAHQSLPMRERFSRTVSVLADYAMRPQLAMAALLVLMVGSSLIFVRGTPSGATSDGMRVVERGVPSNEAPQAKGKTMIFSGDPEGRSRPRAEEDEDAESEEPTQLKKRGTDEEVRKRQRAAYSDAMTAYQQGRYAEAERLFSEVASTGGEQAASAALHEGHAARNGSGCQRAAAIYDAIASRQGGGTISYEASWHAASCYRAMGQNERAVAHYKKLAGHGAFADRALQALTELGAAAERPVAKPASASVAADTKPISALSPPGSGGASANTDTAETPRAEPNAPAALAPDTDDAQK